jgi:hypothetical protein
MSLFIHYYKFFYRQNLKSNSLELKFCLYIGPMP